MSPISEGGSSEFSAKELNNGIESHQKTKVGDSKRKWKDDVMTAQTVQTSAPQLRIASMRLRRKQQLQRSTGWKACGALDLCKALS